MNAGIQKLLLLLSIKKRFLRQRQKHRKTLRRVLTLTQRFYARRRKWLAIFMKMGYIRSLNIRGSPSSWSFARNEYWFSDMWLNRFDDDYRGGRWKLDFRMKGSTFDKLVTLLDPLLKKEDTNFRPAIPVPKRVAIGVWRLATGECFRSISKTFAVGKATAVHIVHEFCDALSLLSNQFIRFPSSPLEVAEAIEKFKDDVNCKIPMVFSAVDGTHICIVAQNCDSKADYYARIKQYTVNTQVIVGANLIFYGIATGFPGSCHDARIWRETEVYRRSEADELLQYPEEVIELVKVKPIILGDGAYPISKNSLKPYPFTNALTRDQKKFNKALSSARVIVY